MLNFDGDVCPRDHHALRDGTCPMCEWRPPREPDLPPRPAIDDLPELDDYRRRRT